MKWAALAFFIIAAPLLSAWLRTNPRSAPLLWGLLGFLPFVTGPWHLIVAPYATPVWSGYVKGWEVSLLDCVAFACAFGTRAKWPKLTLLWPLLLYVFAVSLSVGQARFPTFAWSYVIQLLRVALLMVAVARVTVLEKGERAVLIGLILGIVVQAVYALVDRASGAVQTGGSLGHQNLLGFVSHMVVMPALAMLLSRRWATFGFIGLSAGAVAVILTASRASIALSAAGLALTLVLSMAARMSARKAAVSALSIVFIGACFPLASEALERRFNSGQTQFFQEDQERQAFKRAAWMMIDNKPLGVGANHYVFISNTEGYGEKAGVNWSVGNRTATVHNSFLLVTAETGYAGFITFVFLLGSAIVLGLHAAFRYRRQPGSEVLIGCSVAIVLLCLHGLVEWMFVVYPSQYLLGVTLGIITGLRGRFLTARPSDVTINPRVIGRIEQLQAMPA